MLQPYSLTRIANLQPALQPIAKAFLEQAEASGIPVSIVQDTRTMEQQQALFAQGRTSPGPVVTNARPGDSYHNWALAFDVVPDAYRNMPNWNPSGPFWPRLGAIGKSLGLTWGGDWSTPDRPHFHLEAAPLSELKAYWDKFRQIMPVSITPTTGGLAMILLIGAAWYWFVRPLLDKRGLL
jgi:peptidoglycan L-alanyl-D-glutamate endopeptidase CwlK